MGNIVSAEDVGNFVSEQGDAYICYKYMIIRHNMTVENIKHNLNTELKMHTICNCIGITNPVHIRNLELLFFVEQERQTEIQKAGGRRSAPGLATPDFERRVRQRIEFPGKQGNFSFCSSLLFFSIIQQKCFEGDIDPDSDFDALDEDD